MFGNVGKKKKSGHWRACGELCIRFHERAFTLGLFSSLNANNFLPTSVISIYFIKKRCRLIKCRTLMLMQQHKSSRAVEIIDFRAGGWDSRIPCEGSITFHQHVNEHTKYTCKRTHVSADGHKHAHTQSFCTSSSAFSPREQGWLVGGGRRGLATGAGQRNSGLFTFSLQSSPFRPFSPLPSVFLYSPHPTQLSVPLRGCRLCNERHNYTERANGRAASKVFSLYAV